MHPFCIEKKLHMPANLNALIRYKTINSTLSGGIMRFPISELTKRCSDALAEFRGRYETVSERTIRDDIRVMRSDILGYNAPIAQYKGLYYYSDEDYSIMTLSFTDSGLIERIIHLLDDIKSEVAHPEVEIILEKLNKMKVRHVRMEQKQKKSQTDIPAKLEEAGELKISKAHFRLTDAPLMDAEPFLPYNRDLIWADLFGLLKQ
jgi:hypothetical protein